MAKILRSDTDCVICIPQYIAMLCCFSTKKTLVKGPCETYTGAQQGIGL